MAETVEQDLFYRNLIRTDLRERVGNPRVMHRPLATATVRLPGGGLYQPASGAELAGVALPAPVKRAWPWAISVGPSERRTIVSPRFLGPARIDVLIFQPVQSAGPNTNTLHGIGLWYAEDTDPGTTAQAVEPSGTGVFLPEQQANLAAPAAGGKAYPQAFSTQSNELQPIPLGVLVPLLSFFLKLSIANGSNVTTISFQGVVLLTEGVDPTESCF